MRTFFRDYNFLASAFSFFICCKWAPPCRPILSKSIPIDDHRLFAGCTTRSRTTATIASEDHSRLDQLHVEDGGERLHFACRSDAGREMELHAHAGRVHRCAHFWRTGEALACANEAWAKKLRGETPPDHCDTGG